MDNESVEIVEEEYTGNEDGFPITTVVDDNGSDNVSLSVTTVALDPSVTLKRVVLIAFDDENAVTTDDLRSGVEAE